MKSYKHLVKGLDPVANAFAGTVYSDIVSMSNHNIVQFVIYKGVGATGTSTITVEACDNVSASNVAAVPFRYQKISTGDTAGADTAATTAGFATTAGSSQLYIITAEAEALAASGYEFIRLKAVEVVASAVLGGILIIQDEPRENRPVQSTTIV